VRPRVPGKVHQDGARDKIGWKKDGVMKRSRKSKSSFEN